MITLHLHDNFYAAYDAQRCALYKVWRGGVHWDGAPYNKIKTIQPESWGHAFYDDPRTSSPWSLKSDEQLTFHFKGYEIADNRLTFRYEGRVGNATFLIEENPEIEIKPDGGIEFVRTIQTTGLPSHHALWYRDQEITGGETRIVTPLADVQPEYVARLVSANPGMMWLEKSGCNTCHEVEERTVGPSYRDIAARYHDNRQARSLLTEKVVEGGAGVWGSSPMPPHPHLAIKDIEQMVKFILDLEPAEEAPIVRKKQETKEENRQPGFGQPLSGVHPSLQLEQVRPIGFEPRVGGMDMMSDGSLVISTWDSLGAVYRLQGVDGDISNTKVTMIASGLAEPLGLKVVDDEIYVLQKQELTRLSDRDSDGLIDTYETICDAFGVTADFHEFSYGLDYYDGHFYATLGVAMRLLSSEEQHEDRGTVIRISPTGDVKIIARGLRQPNGVEVTPAGDIFITENQGQWVPANKLIHVREGDFYGCQFNTGKRFATAVESPPAVWLPQDEIGNSPGQPLHIPSGLYAGQMLHCDVTHGGLKRSYLEQINGQWQGGVFRFTQGLEAGMMRLVWGGADQLYAGGLAMTGGWGWKERFFGLQRILFERDTAFEMQKVSATPSGIEIAFTEAPATFSKEDIFVSQWRYEATANYGGPKIDEQLLEIGDIKSSSEGKIISVDLPGMNAGYVIYIRLSDELMSVSDRPLWTGECWYTMNNIPDHAEMNNL